MARERLEREGPGLRDGAVVQAAQLEGQGGVHVREVERVPELVEEGLVVVLPAPRMDDEHDARGDLEPRAERPRRLARPGLDVQTDPAVRDEYLDIIINESERLTRLLNNVLDFSRIESGRKIYHFAPQDLASIVRTAARAMHYPLAQQGFALQIDIADEIPPVHGDPDALEQAILNLLANALKYSGTARKIELRLARDDGHAVIAVRDWGIGIDPADQRRIFDKFYRVARPENRLIPGTGLGLTLVDHIARAHHGFVALESTPGEGSTFRIHVPFAAREPAPAGQESEPERAPVAGEGPRVSAQQLASPKV